jgi:hypothetical protein
VIILIDELHDKILAGEQVTTNDKGIYEKLCKALDEDGVDYVSGDIDPHYPDEPYYIELNGRI